MRQLHTELHFRHALFALQDADGYVDALLDMARNNVAEAGSALSLRRSNAGSRAERSKGALQNRTGSPD